MKLEDISNENSDYQNPSMLDIVRASVQPGFTFIDAEMRAGNKKYLTPSVRVAAYLMEATKIGIYAFILSQYT